MTEFQEALANKAAELAMVSTNFWINFPMSIGVGPVAYSIDQEALERLPIPIGSEK